MIPPGFVQELLTRVDVAEVIGRHVELKRSGINLMGLCPFHAEKSASFSVTPGKGLYYCFGCGAGGDAVRFLMDHLGLSFVEAVRDLAQRVGLAVPEEDVSPQERERRETLRQRRLTLAQALERAAGFYRAQLKGAPRAVAYLKGRGLTGAIAARFGLGYAPPGWRSLAGVFGAYDDPLLEEAGLVRVKGRQGREGREGREGAEDAEAESGSAEAARYDWFRDRVMFPIRNVAGEIIGFGGRVLDDSKPKYINSPETTLFNKGRELYGLYEARQALREHGCALVVEGYMDVVALAQHGFGNAVATLGTACSAEHVAKLFRFTDSIVFSFDGDAAGRRAAGRALEAALPLATDLRSIKFLFLPSEHDPDSFVRELGTEAFAEAIAAAVPLSRQLIEHCAEGQDLGTAEGRARLLGQARPLWATLPEGGALRRQILAEIARAARLEVADLASLWQLHERAERGRSTMASQPSPPLTRPGLRGRRAPPAPADQAVRMLLMHSDWLERLGAEDHQLLHEIGPPHSEVVSWLERRLTEDGALTWAALVAAAGGEPWLETARAWVEAAAPEEHHQQFGELEVVLHRIWVKRLQADVDRVLSEGRADDEHKEKLRVLYREIERHQAAARSVVG